MNPINPLHVTNLPDDVQCYQVMLDVAFDAGVAAQPVIKPLTDERILEVARDHYNPHQRAEISFARAIEAAHNIKE